MADPLQSREAGGFIQPTLPSPQSSSATSPPALVLPQPRSSPLKAGGAKERDLLNHVEQKLLAISRRYENRFNAELGIVSLDAEGCGYEGFQEQARDLGSLVDVLWTSGTREMRTECFESVPEDLTCGYVANLQTPFLLSIAMTACTSLPSFPFAPRATFQLLHKLDLAFCSLLQGTSTETGERLPGFGGGRGRLSTTEKVRMRSIVERTRIAVVEVAGEDSSVLDAHTTDQSQAETDDDFNMTEDDNTGQLDDGGVYRRWEMEIARVYERTMVELGTSLDTANNNWNSLTE